MPLAWNLFQKAYVRTFYWLKCGFGDFLVPLQTFVAILKLTVKVVSFHQKYSSW